MDEMENLSQTALGLGAVVSHPYAEDKSYLRQHALSMAHHPDHSPTEVIARANVYLDFLTK